MASRPIPASTTHFSKTKFRILTLCLALTASGLFLIGLIIILFYLYKTLFSKPSKTSPFDSSTSANRLHHFSYNELKLATNSWTNELGRGSTGSVFMGSLKDGRQVAVKKLRPDMPLCEREFQNELSILAGLNSPFIVSLLGYCIDKKRRLLVYEHLPNKSLQEALFSSPMVLDWEKRFKIIIDIAEALGFLHLQCDPPIVHGDIKPSNVLLDSNFRAKVSDFGLSRVKNEGEFGIDLFSQELVGKSQELWKSQELIGKSQELWKSQDLGKNCRGKPKSEISDHTVNQVAETANLASDTEVDFALALQASCSHSRLELSPKNCDFNGFSTNGEDGLASNLKGKEVSIEPEDSEDELCSFDHSKELSNASPVDTKQWGKDWWWRQDGSGELCSRDYVMEWIGNQICPSRNPDWDDKRSPEKPEKEEVAEITKKTQVVEMARHDRELSFNENGSTHKFRGAKGKSSAKDSKKNRKIKEWWKEEYFAEMSKKGKKLRKLDKNRRSFRLLSCLKKTGFLGENQIGKESKWGSFRFPNCLNKNGFPGENRIEKENNCEGSNKDGELSFGKNWRRKRNRSTANSELWSGDLFSRELSSTTSMRGTVCYVAPEYGGCGYLMEKGDIYSFGVLILVIISGRRPLHVLASPMKLEKANLVSWCRQLAQTGNTLDLVDERLGDKYNNDQASLCINLALVCLQRMPELRPDIGEILRVLKGEMELSLLPFEFSPSPPCKLYSRSRRRQTMDTE
ncbi:hypothetical protein AMTRI_Chr12g273280 [Amborella trichopoda]